MNKDSNTTVLKMLKELRKIQRKCKKKIMNKIETSIKKKSQRNSGVENYNN